MTSSADFCAGHRDHGARLIRMCTTHSCRAHERPVSSNGLPGPPKVPSAMPPTSPWSAIGVSLGVKAVLCAAERRLGAALGATSFCEKCNRLSCSAGLWSDDAPRSWIGAQRRLMSERLIAGGQGEHRDSGFQGAELSGFQAPPPPERERGVYSWQQCCCGAGWNSSMRCAPWEGQASSLSATVCRESSISCTGSRVRRGRLWAPSGRKHTKELLGPFTMPTPSRMACSRMSGATRRA